MMRASIKRSIVLLLGLVALVSTVRAQEAAVPAEFKYVGTYLLEKRIKVRGGEVFRVAMKPIEYRIYTDGISIRLYGGGESGGYTRYEVYRSEGILEAPDRSTIETVAGVQAKSTTGGVLRNITLTRRQLMITRHPAVSGVVEIVYAGRVLEDFEHKQVTQEIRSDE